MHIGFAIEKKENPETGEIEFDAATYYDASQWANDNNARIVEYESFYRVEENPPPPPTKTVRTFSKFSIWVATYEMPLMLKDGTKTTVWDEFEKFLASSKLQRGWDQLVDLVEDNPFFEIFYPKAVEAFGKELVDSVLAASVTSTKEVIITHEPDTTEGEL